jgi:hypothetical protein
MKECKKHLMGRGHEINIAQANAKKLHAQDLQNTRPTLNRLSMKECKKHLMGRGHEINIF